MKEKFLQMCKEADEKLSTTMAHSKVKAATLHISKIGDSIDIDIVKEKETKTRHGKSYKKLEDYLNDIERESSINNMYDIACYTNSKKCGNTYEVEFVIVSVSELYQLNNGVLKFDTINKTLSEKEYQLVRETGLCFYDVVNNNLYPILKSCVNSIGKYLDATASFKDMAKTPIGGALVLAEKLTQQKKGLKIVYINMFDNIRPVVCVGSDKSVNGMYFKYYTDFFNTMASKIGMYNIVDWAVSYERSMIHINASYQGFELMYCISNIPGESNTIKVGKTINNKFICFSSASGYKTSKYNFDAVLDKALKKAAPIKKKFLELAALTSCCEKVLTETELAMLVKAIGKKRLSVAKTSFDGTPIEVITQLIENFLDEKLPQKQYNEVIDFIVAVIKNW